MATNEWQIVAAVVSAISAVAVSAYAIGVMKAQVKEIKTALEKVELHMHQSPCAASQVIGSRQSDLVERVVELEEKADNHRQRIVALETKVDSLSE